MLVDYQFILPFYVRLPAHGAIQFPYNGKLVIIRTRKIEGERIDSYRRGSYDWLSNGEEDGKWYAVAAVKNGERIPFREVLILNGAGSPVRGIRDQKVYSLVDVYFEIDTTDVDAATGDDVQDWVQEVLNRFIEWYRVVSDEVTAHAEDISSSAVVRVNTASEYEFGPEGVGATFQPAGQILNWDQPENLGMTKDELGGQSLEALARSLQTDKDLDLHVSLLLEAKEMSHSYGRHNLAIVLLETSFEVFLQTRLMSHCQQREIRELELSGTPRPISDALADGGLRSDLLRNFPEQISGVNLRTAGSYDGWLKNTYRPRNQIVHAGERGYGEDDAEEAFEAARDFSEEISRMMEAA